MFIHKKKKIYIYIYKIYPKNNVMSTKWAIKRQIELLYIIVIKPSIHITKCALDTCVF